MMPWRKKSGQFLCKNVTLKLEDCHYRWQLSTVSVYQRSDAKYSSFRCWMCWLPLYYMSKAVDWTFMEEKNVFLQKNELVQRQRSILLLWNKSDKDWEEKYFRWYAFETGERPSYGRSNFFPVFTTVFNILIFKYCNHKYFLILFFLKKLLSESFGFRFWPKVLYMRIFCRKIKEASKTEEKTFFCFQTIF